MVPVVAPLAKGLGAAPVAGQTGWVDRLQRTTRANCCPYCRTAGRRMAEFHFQTHFAPVQSPHPGVELLSNPHQVWSWRPGLVLVSRRLEVTDLLAMDPAALLVLAHA